MGLLGNLIFGVMMYLAGFLAHQKLLKKHRNGQAKFPLSHPLIVKCLILCFIIMLAVSALIGRFVLHHDGFDWAFILVNSLLATLVFYFGLNPDTTKMNLPE